MPDGLSGFGLRQAFPVCRSLLPAQIVTIYLQILWHIELVQTFCYNTLHIVVEGALCHERSADILRTGVGFRDRDPGLGAD